MGFKVSGGKKRVKGEERDFENDKASNNSHSCTLSAGFSGGSAVNNLPANQETQVQSSSQEDPLEKEMTTHSSILVWEIPWTEKPGGLQFMGSQKSQT